MNTTLTIALNSKDLAAELGAASAALLEAKREIERLRAVLNDAGLSTTWVVPFESEELAKATHKFLLWAYDTYSPAGEPFLAGQRVQP